ncbi:cyclic nucleotide-binding protein [Gordonibacter sp. An230]|nr:cyclic nucleotide-binding protein [Gordonibacter sp. An230]
MPREGDDAKLPSFASSCLAHPVYSDFLRRQTYKTAETVRAQESPIREFGIVAEGCLKSVRYTVDGHELCNGYFEKDDVFPELLYFTGKKVYTYNLLAVRKTTVMWLDTSFFELMLRTDSQMLYRFMLYLSKRGLKNQMLLCCLRYQTIRERIAFWVLWMDDVAQNGCIELPSSQTIWANELRVSRSSLNQEAKRMEKMGYFRMKDHRLEVLDRPGLERLV